MAGGPARLARHRFIPNWEDIPVMGDEDQNAKLELTAPVAHLSSLSERRFNIAFIEICRLYAETNPGAKVPWGPRHGKMLKNVLASIPSWTESEILACVRNRFASDVNPAEDPARWLQKLTDYRAGPLDRFGKPAYSGNVTGILSE